ncbi:hypothetical protein [Ramlibacter sp.]|uniref:hypothetical protein n=1 Tax=Ramlibacter sp. TaxID=1917967 RepID=UPI003D14DCAE
MKTAGHAILFSEMTPPTASVSEFHAWYDTEHIPIRMRSPGFVSAQRYRLLDAPSYLAVYELEAKGALDTEAYRKIKTQPSDLTARMLGEVTGFTRYTCEQIGEAWGGNFDATTGLEAPVLYAVWFDVPQERQEEFDAWYEQDHVPTLLECADWRGARRFSVASGEPRTFTRLALHYIETPGALDSPERAKARASPWRAKLAEESWFKGAYTVFAKHGARQLATGQREFE